MKATLRRVVQRLGGIAQPSDLGDIGIELQRMATQETAMYVAEHMSKIMSCSARLEVHDVALKKIPTDGLILEFGVFSGKTANHIASNVGDRTVHGFDSFEGLPEFWKDGFDEGAFSVDGLPDVAQNVELHKGWFDKSIPEFLKVIDSECQSQIAYLHVDCDLYSSTKTIFEALGHMISKGTVIVFDEYFNYPGWKQDEYLAFKEFVTMFDLKYEYLTYNRKHQQVAVVIC